MRFLDLDGSGGNQDRSLSANAVAVKRNVIVTKNTFGGNGTFSFTLTGPGGVTMSATISTTGTTLTGSGTATFTGLAPGTYTVTEAANPDFVPVGATMCTAAVASAAATPSPPALNNAPNAAIVATKQVDGDSGSTPSSPSATGTPTPPIRGAGTTPA